MYIIPILAISVLFQLVATYLALRLIRIAGGRKVWISAAIGMALMALRRALVLYQISSGTPGANIDTAGEVIALVVSLLLILALASLGPLTIPATRGNRTFREQEEALPPAHRSRLRRHCHNGGWMFYRGHRSILQSFWISTSRAYWKTSG